MYEDIDWGSVPIWGSDWTTAMQRGDYNYAKRLEEIMRAQGLNASGMNNATNAWWNARLGNVSPNAQPLNLGQIAYTQPSAPNYQQINQGAYLNANGNWSGGNTGAGWDTGIINKFYKKPSTSQQSTYQPNTPQGLSDIDWSGYQNNTQGTANTNRRFDINTGTYKIGGY